MDFWICKGAHLVNVWSETQGGALDLYHGDQTFTDLRLYGFVTEGQIQCRQDIAQ